MNESTSSSTNGFPAPEKKPWDKDVLWGKVAANNAACKTGTERKPAIQASADIAVSAPSQTRGESSTTEFATSNQGEAAPAISSLSEIGAACQTVCESVEIGAESASAIPRAVSAALDESAISKMPLNILDDAKPLNPKGFPNRKKGSDAVLPTLPNFQHMLQAYGITVQYDVIKKRLVVTIPGHCGTVDNYDNVALTLIYSLAILNGMPTGQIAGFLLALGDRNSRNPVADWVLSEAWDGKDRFVEFSKTIQERKGYPTFMKKILLRRWLLSAVAAVLMVRGFRCRGVLVLQGKQGIGKGEFFKALVPDPVLCALVILCGHHLDGASKDSMTTAITHWIVELGELDSSFKKEIARLKAFLTGDFDKVRRPYGRVDSEYPRRTVFGASVNDNNYLVDDTGNSRWWTIACESIDYQHGIDMQQLFAQLAVDYHKGEQWWLTQEEEQMLEEVNKSHRVVSMLRERVLGAIDLQTASGTQMPAMTAIEVLEEVGIQRPTNPQCKECASILREIYGDPKKVNGRYVWRVALNRDIDATLDLDSGSKPTASVDDDDLY